MSSWECYTDGEGYTCESSSPDQVTIRKRLGCGAVTESTLISVPDSGGIIRFTADINMKKWSNPIRIETTGGPMVPGAGTLVTKITRGTVDTKTYEIDVNSYAGRHVRIIITSSDRTMYCRIGDHNFDLVIRDFSLTTKKPELSTPVRNSFNVVRYNYTNRGHSLESTIADLKSLLYTYRNYDVSYWEEYLSELESTSSPPKAIIEYRVLSST